MPRKADPNLPAKIPVTTYLTEAEMAKLDGIALAMGRISRAAVLRALIQLDRG